MKNKVLMILCDGMRPDAVELCGNSFVSVLKAESAYNPHAQTVFPSYTLPCHMSLFHSCYPKKHGTVQNIYIPFWGKGLFEQLRDNGKSTAMFYSWGELKDIYKPYSLCYSKFISETYIESYKMTEMLTEDCQKFIFEQMPDFVFLYLETTDSVGHSKGWGTTEYYDAANHSFMLIEQITSTLPEDYSVIVLADHGGHDFTHGSNEPIDMTIPLFIKTDREIHAEHFDMANIIDIAPTVCDMVGIPHSVEWDGKSLIR